MPPHWLEAHGLTADDDLRPRPRWRPWLRLVPGPRPARSFVQGQEPGRGGKQALGNPGLSHTRETSTGPATSERISSADGPSTAHLTFIRRRKRYCCEGQRRHQKLLEESPSPAWRTRTLTAARMGGGRPLPP